MKRNPFSRKRNFVAYGVFSCLLVFLINTGFQAYSQEQNKRRNEIKEEESFERPQPTRPIAPEIPGVNRYQEDKVFLEYADSLYKVRTQDTVERQILKGNVKFRQAGMWMFCDSAYYYPEENSLDAFSNVRMEQGDTLFVYADKLFYNGDEHLARLKNGPTRQKVTLINNDVTLTTDSLDYNMEIDLGWYVKWGTIEDKVNTLTSLYGEYSPKTKRAEFFTDVVLVNKKDGFTMLTDTLYYSTDTHIAEIESRTEIRSENDTIFTNLATYYTDTGDADLLSRSLIIHRDSTGNITTLEGDSIVYDNTSRISRAYMFKDPFKHSAPMVITDTAQKMILLGGFGIYNDSTREALATIYPLLMEYSQGDTLFLRADTIKTFIVTEKVPAPPKRSKSGFPEFNDEIIVKGDSTGYLWIDSTFFTGKLPFVHTLLELLYPPKPKETSKPSDNIKPFNIEDTPTDSFLIPSDNLGPEEEEGEELSVLAESINMDEPEIPQEEISVDLPEDNPDNDDSDLINLLSLKPSEDIDTIPKIPEEIIKADSITKEFHVALAYHRGRFFKQDMQGVADSIVFVERDSMLYLFRKPIIWSEERQVTGNRIDVHFNDSTTDWAYLPEFGLMSEYVDEDFYNQIFGKEITAYFNGTGLRRMSVSGNVETIFLPQEEDSTYNRLVNAESSYMEVYLDSNKLDWLKMWPEVSGTVTPIFLVKRTQMYLPKFKWWGFLRPEREWYGDRMRWADNLGEVPDELEQYFLAPSDFGEPKSFTGPRIIVPPTTLPIWEDFPEMELSDSLLYISSGLDSLINDTITPLPPDSLIFEMDSSGMENAEKTETLQDILDINEEVMEDAKETETEAEEIEKEVTAIKEEEAVKEEEDE